MSQFIRLRDAILNVDHISAIKKHPGGCAIVHLQNGTRFELQPTETRDRQDLEAIERELTYAMQNGAATK